MKPTKLILCGWGPYKEKQEIEFEKLDNRGLFLITGATGAGKTTIFDAITYALYGNMSGMVREKSSVRSDFAKEDVPTYVELYMTHGGEKYHIYRNPEYMRPKKRKTGDREMTKEKERAVLTYPDGEAVEGSSEVTRRIQELLCLDYRQFKQLSLIAQGEFAKLLTASSTEKSRIFREIFDTEMYDKVTGELRARAGRLYKQVMEYRHKMEEDIHIFEPLETHRETWENMTEDGHYYYDKITAFLEETLRVQTEECASLKNEMMEAQKQTEEMTVLLTEAERINGLFEKHVAEMQRKEALAEKAGSMEETESRLKRAEKALVVKNDEQAWKQAQLQVEGVKNALNTLEMEMAALKEKQKEGVALLAKKELIEKAYQEDARYKELLAERQKNISLIALREKELTQVQEEYLEAERREDAAKAEFESAEKRYRHGIAGILATELKENLPCPVCGSITHPQKAVLSKDMPTGEEVDHKKQTYEELRKQSEEINRKAAVCKEKTESILMMNRELQEKIAVQEESNSERDPYVTEILKKYTKEEFLKQKEMHELILVRCTEKKARLEERQEELETCMEQKKDAGVRFQNSLVREGFAHEEDYRNGFLSPDRMDEMRRMLSAYKESVYANLELIAHIERELEGREKCNLEEMREILESHRHKRDAIREEWTRKSHYESDIGRLLTSLKEKLVKVKILEQEYGVIKKLEDAASGNNRLRLVFEQYVLAAYFDEILKAANIRLKAMSVGRYELKRAEGVGGGRTKDNLEMEVLDYYTGKYRSVKTLSGGESFKTSLALALGMSDVVQALSGGIRVEALFIDEGFGSLDSESLEQACMTLQSLVEKERLIGIISHVPELAEKIGNQIIIHKTNVGSKVEVVVS